MENKTKQSFKEFVKAYLPLIIIVVSILAIVAVVLVSTLGNNNSFSENPDDNTPVITDPDDDNKPVENPDDDQEDPSSRCRGMGNAGRQLYDRHGFFTY